MKKWLLIFFLTLPAFAVVVAPATIPHVTFVNASGGPCSTCTLQSFLAGTSTPTPTYTDSTGVSQNTNPIILDAAGGANIWLGNLAYKLILKDPTGTIIWTVDNVKGGGGLGGVCGVNGPIQAANSTGNGLTCDPTITINTTAHTLNIGTITPNHVTIGALGTPTAWTFDTTTPATALASLGTSFGNITALSLGVGSSGQFQVDSGGSVTTTGNIGGTGIFASTSFVGPIGVTTPNTARFTTSSASGGYTGDLTGNASTATQLAATPSQCPSGQPAVGIAANGNANCTTAVDYYWSVAGSCVVGVGQPNACDFTASLPGNMPDSNYQIFCTANVNFDTPADSCNIKQADLPTTAGGSIGATVGQYMQRSTPGTDAPTVYFHAHHN